MAVVDGVSRISMLATMKTEKPSLRVRSAMAWAVRLGGLYVVFAIPWCVWKAYSQTPFPPPPSNTSPEVFHLIVAMVMFVVGIVSFLMFLNIYRKDVLKMAREIEAWDFPQKASSTDGAES